MVSLVAVLLAVSSLPGQASLLEPAPVEPRPSARLLVALQDPRSQLEDELRELKQSRPEPAVQAWRDGRAESFIPVAALSF